jgi:CO dehydrogenase maturation factor
LVLIQGQSTGRGDMKIAVVGKGGVGKTTLAASLARVLARGGRPVVAVDADPDGNLASALGVPPERVPESVVSMRELIRERTNASDEGWGLMFKLNPKVDDLPDRFSVDADGVKLLVLGTVETGGKGCMCPEGAVLKALMQHLFLRVEDDVVLDMEAGLEHLGRASATGVDAMIAVVEPGMRSVRTAMRVRALASDIGVERVFVVLNRVSDDEERTVLMAHAERDLKGAPVLGVLPYSKALARADLEGRSVKVDDTAFGDALAGIESALRKELGDAPA